MTPPRTATAQATAQILRGLVMGAADVVPGVSGGTVALVLGIYERLVEAIRSVARTPAALVTGDWRRFRDRVRAIDWQFLMPLAAGIVVAVVALASVIETRLRTHPTEMAGLFAGLVVASTIVAASMIRTRRLVHLAVVAAVAVAVFAGLGLRAGPVPDPSPVVLVAAGMITVCAMILPGISGSFLLLMMGLYGAAITIVHERRYGDGAALALGALVGVALFSSLLGRLLERAHDWVMAVMVGLMIGSLRVLWPWPDGVGVMSSDADEVVTGTGLGWPTASEWFGPTALAVAGFVVVLAWSRWAERATPPTGLRKGQR